MTAERKGYYDYKFTVKAHPRHITHETQGEALTGVGCISYKLYTHITNICTSVTIIFLLTCAARPYYQHCDARCVLMVQLCKKLQSMRRRWWYIVNLWVVVGVVAP